MMMVMMMLWCSGGIDNGTVVNMMIIMVQWW